MTQESTPIYKEPIGLGGTESTEALSSRPIARKRQFGGAVNLSLITSKSLNTPEAVANTPTRDSRAKSVSIIEDDVLATSSRGKEGSYSPPASPLATSPNRGGPGSSFVVSKRPPLSTPILSKPRPQLYSKDSHKSSPNLLENQRTELEIENSPPVFIRKTQNEIIKHLTKLNDDVDQNHSLNASEKYNKKLDQALQLWTDLTDAPQKKSSSKARKHNRQKRALSLSPPKKTKSSSSKEKKGSSHFIKTNTLRNSTQSASQSNQTSPTKSKAPLFLVRQGSFSLSQADDTIVAEPLEKAASPVQLRGSFGSVEDEKNKRDRAARKVLHSFSKSLKDLASISQDLSEDHAAEVMRTLDRFSPMFATLALKAKGDERALTVVSPKMRRPCKEDAKGAD